MPSFAQTQAELMRINDEMRRRERAVHLDVARRDHPNMTDQALEQWAQDSIDRVSRPWRREVWDRAVDTYQALQLGEFSSPAWPLDPQGVLTGEAIYSDQASLDRAMSAHTMTVDEHRMAQGLSTLPADYPITHDGPQALRPRRYAVATDMAATYHPARTVTDLILEELNA